ncbi:hypothetical protein L537_3576 [Bordetella hinzii 1277]|nr:hypothetical protein L538_3303 [Bordetella hinzii 4161]KCB52674.1 hypothetical protein L537_3576 [Bordetella hinzii 1277]
MSPGGPFLPAAPLPAALLPAAPFRPPSDAKPPTTSRRR